MESAGKGLVSCGQTFPTFIIGGRGHVKKQEREGLDTLNRILCIAAGMLAEPIRLQLRNESYQRL